MAVVSIVTLFVVAVATVLTLVSEMLTIIVTPVVVAVATIVTLVLEAVQQ